MIRDYTYYYVYQDCFNCSLSTLSYDWEIKCYSCEEEFNLYPCKAYLKNSGVVNLNEKFGGYISQGCELDLMLSWGQCIWCPSGFPFSKIWYIPNVD